MKKTLTVIVLLLVGLAPTLMADPWDANVDRATAAYNRDDYSTAERFFSRAVEAGCEDGVVLYRFAYSTEQLDGLEFAGPLYVNAQAALADGYPNHRYLASAQLKARAYQPSGGAAPAATTRRAGAVSVEEAKESFMVSFVSVFSVSIGLAFGQEIPGATLDPETEELRLEDFNLAALAAADSEIPYTSISGSVITEDGAMIADLTLGGGPVETIEFTLGSEQLQSQEGFSVTVTVNGRDIELEITEVDMP
jgi:hypothetical protein